MEKFSSLKDISTGIHPFLVPFKRRTGFTKSFFSVLTFFLCSVIAWGILCPIIFFTDLVAYFFRLINSERLAVVFVIPIAHFFTRIFVFFAGAGLRITKPRKFPNNFQSKCSGKEFSSSHYSFPPVGASNVKIEAGDIVMMNMQSFFDPHILLASSFSTYHSFMPFFLAVCVVPSESLGRSLICFKPSPWQRWSLMFHFWYTSKFSFFNLWDKSSFHQSLKSEKNSVIPLNESSSVDLRPFQLLASELRVPILLFPEGTCSNGKGILQTPHVIVQKDTHKLVHNIRLRYEKSEIYASISSYYDQPRKKIESFALSPYSPQSFFSRLWQIHYQALGNFSFVTLDYFFNEIVFNGKEFSDGAYELAISELMTSARGNSVKQLSIGLIDKFTFLKMLQRGVKIS